VQARVLFHAVVGISDGLRAVAEARMPVPARSLSGYARVAPAGRGAAGGSSSPCKISGPGSRRRARPRPRLLIDTGPRNERRIPERLANRAVDQKRAIDLAHHAVVTRRRTSSRDSTSVTGSSAPRDRQAAPDDERLAASDLGSVFDRHATVGRKRDLPYSGRTLPSLDPRRWWKRWRRRAQRR
jgi:hypothetical protein